MHLSNERVGPPSVGTPLRARRSCARRTPQGTLAVRVPSDRRCHTTASFAPPLMGRRMAGAVTPTAAMFSADSARGLVWLSQRSLCGVCASGAGDDDRRRRRIPLPEGPGVWRRSRVDRAVQLQYGTEQASRPGPVVLALPDDAERLANREAEDLSIDQIVLSAEKVLDGTVWHGEERPDDSRTVAARLAELVDRVVPPCQLRGGEDGSHQGEPSRGSPETPPSPIRSAARPRRFS